MRILERARFEEIMEGDNPNFSKQVGDNAFQGLMLLNLYLPNTQHSLIEGADHDIIYSVDVQKILNAGLTEEDAIKLRDLNWMIQEDGLACYV